ncbi:MAG: GNAT family N-acetyltransferase [Thermoleophilia bacterium]|nr:GNAT family N-acetyltransferase [Thermoleophilia bacterium]
MSVLLTDRLELWPITLPLVEAVMRGDREEVERLANAPLPAAWPGRALIERAFAISLEDLRADPETRLWGDRLMILKGESRRVVGSVIFHGRPGADGIAEVGYGVEDDSQGLGYATEAVRASVRWALSQPGVRAVHAATFDWHKASLRVIEKCEMVQVGTREHEVLGEVLVFEIRAPGA